MQFTCFTSTKVQILTHFGQGKELLACVQRDGPDEEPFAIGTHFTCFTSTEVQILTAGVYRLCLDISDDSVHDSLDMSLTRAIALESPSKLTLSKSDKEELLAQAEEQRAFLLRRWSGSGFFNLTCFTGTKVHILTLRVYLQRRHALLPLSSVYLLF